MEVLNRHITPNQIEGFLSKNTNTIWLTVCDELCILYGVGRYNNPTNLPTYHTHEQGGIIVCFPEDICFGYVSDTDSDIGERFLHYMGQYLGLRGQVDIDHNDLLYNGRKVLSYSKKNINNKYVISFHLSVDMDVNLVQSICTKLTWKRPGGLKHFGYTHKELLNKTIAFLNQEENPAQEEHKTGNGPIDICVMWVDPSSQRWKDEYNFYKKKELLNKTQTILNEGAFNTARYQDWGVFQYWFRGVEKNCPWVNKVFLIVEDEDQIPLWLNINHPKLRIVYHREFIPEDLLPLFNGPAIEMWYSNIPDLSENFIACDDDYYFYNTIPSDLFFENNVPQTEIIPSTRTYLRVPAIAWQCMMANDRDLIKRIMNKEYNYKPSHLPEARKKSFEGQILKEQYIRIHDAIKHSHFRSEYSYTAWMFIDLMKARGVSKNKPIYNNSALIQLGNASMLRMQYKRSYDMICFNDVSGKIDPASKDALLFILNEHFPEKSSWEV